MLKNIIILLPFLISLFWTINFFFNRKINSRSQNIWTIAIGLICITMVISAFYWYAKENYSLFYKLDIIETFTTLSFVPVIFLYFREVTGNFKKWTNLKISLLFFPAILFTTATVFIYLYIGDEASTAYSKGMIEQHGDSAESVLSGFPLLSGLYLIINEYTYSLVLFIQTVAVIIYASYRLLLYRRRMNDFFSNVDDEEIKNHWAVFGGILAFLILTLVTTGLGLTLYVEFHSLILFVPFLYAVILYFICYHVSCTYYKAEKLAVELNLPGDITIRDEDESFDADDKNNIHLKFLPKFNQAIDEDKLYLQKGLRVDDLAAVVGTNRAYISRILKDEYDCSFWEFINRKRIEYAKEQILQHPDLTQEELAQNSGFTHDSAFSRAFRQYEGITFREWRKSGIGYE